MDKDELINRIKGVVDSAYDNLGRQVYTSLFSYPDREADILAGYITDVRTSLADLRDEFLPDKYSTDNVAIWTKEIKWFHTSGTHDTEDLGWIREIIIYAEVRDNANTNFPRFRDVDISDESGRQSNDASNNDTIEPSRPSDQIRGSSDDVSGGGDLGGTGDQ